MLSRKILDDQNFIEILNRARRQIQKYAPDWTNENASDPGMALLEMLAWLKDNLQYYMDQSHLISQHAYLDLLGIEPENGVPSQMIARANFDKDTASTSEPIILPKGFPFTADGTSYELAYTTVLQNVSLKHFYSANADFKGRVIDLNLAFENGARAYAFGEKPEKGACLYLGFDTLLNGELSLYFDMEDDPAHFRNPSDKCNLTFAEGIWEIAQTTSDLIQWKPVEVLVDETCSFMYDGIVTLNINQRVETFNLIRGESALVWLRYRLIKSSYDRPPVCKNILVNGLRLAQQKTHMFCEEHGVPLEGQPLVVEHYVSEDPYLSVEYLTDQGFKSLENTQYMLNRSEYGKSEIHMNDHFPNTPFMRIVSGSRDDAQNAIYSVRGLPYERIETRYNNLLFNSVSLEIKDDFRNQVYKPWTPVLHLWNGASSSKQVYLNAPEGILEFGNNEIGLLPDPSENGLRFISAASSLKDKGNGQYQKLMSAQSLKSLSFEILTRSRGGKRQQTLDEALASYRELLETPHALISKAHIEQIIMNTSGLAIRDVAVVPADNGFQKGRIVVLPKSESHEPVLLDVYKKRLKAEIETKRLITENWKISGPEYIDIRLKIEILKDPAIPLSRDQISSVVRAFIEPDIGKLFGKRYASSKLTRKLEKISGVIRVSRLEMRVKGTGFNRADGDIQLPITAIGRLADLDVSIISSQGW